ncbi:SRA stem-loop-interacting RNA-binding protein, mitochondrial [Pogona vitticeps]|nr:SRA stem-loop-interacting RNA-binding protein, mitochondrial [Pogona vitticeps]
MAAGGMSQKAFKIFVRRLPWTVGPNEIKTYFAQFGAVKNYFLPFDKKTGFHKGVCWVGFVTEEGVENALQKKSHILEGAKIIVDISKGRAFSGEYMDRRKNDTS